MHLPYMERLKQLKLPTLKYRCMRGDMKEVFKLVHNYYNSGTTVNLNFNTSSMARGNMYKLQKFTCHYNLREYSFCSRVVKIWNSLPNKVAEVDTINILKNRLDKYCTNQKVF